MALTVVFDRGTLRLAGADELLPFTKRDPASGELRAPAYRFGDLAAWLDACGRGLEGDLRRAWDARPRPIDDLGLRPYQEEALASWEAFGRRGVVALPTGAGKTRVAIAAMRATGLPALVLCPTRALLAAWAEELAKRFDEPIGVVGDGKRRLERVTVMTFESGFRHLSEVGDRFGLLVVDEVHHFAGGIRSEALEACAAPARLGLSATAPRAGSEGAERLSALIGPVVYEVGVRALVGRHLAELSVLQLPVCLAEDERAAYERLVEPLKQMRRAWFRANRRATYAAFVRAMSADEAGRRAMRAYARGLDIAYFPREKRATVRALLARHRGDRTIVFTARAEDAYRVATDSLVPVITAEVSAAERARILARFRAGSIRAIATARVLNEGIDVPDARVAIVVAGTLGEREHVQRIGRVLRPAPGKRALCYELVTLETVDARLAAARGAHAAAAPA
ncbi:MAG TPA: DEAD/DEAH box helicase family protein [Labilithrix sp.]